MRNRIQALLCAVLMVVCCLGVAACGSSDESQGEQTEAEATAEDAAEQAAEAEAEAQAAAENERVQKFMGSWETAGCEMNETTVTGDFEALLGTGLDMALSVEDGGTGTLSYMEQEYPVEWHVADDALSIASVQEITGEDILFNFRNRSDEEQYGVAMDFTYEDDALVLAMSGLGVDGRVILTHDGTLPDMPAISVQELEPIASEKDALGTWNLRCVLMEGATVYGEGDELLNAMGFETEEDNAGTLSIEKENAATFMGSPLGWEAGDDGLVLTDGETQLPLSSVDGLLAVDMSSLAESSLVLVYEK